MADGKKKSQDIEVPEEVSFEEHNKEISYDEATFDPEAFQKKFMSQDKLRTTNTVSMALMKTDEIETIVESYLADKEGIYVEDRGPYYYVACDGEVVLDFDEIEEDLGRSYSVFDFLVNLSTTVGRALTVDNKFILTTRLIGIEDDGEEVSPKKS
ncbi:MAG: hypothetical protein COA65_08160 [Rhodospirillaceae bacterium]|nr:MAG: hypothetical protein COA65_08160 [Rhodospirillaceae bacterium]